MRMIWSSRFCFGQHLPVLTSEGLAAHLETLVLENTLDGRIFAVRGKLGVEDHTEGTISYDLALGVLHLSCLASDSILHLLADDLYK